MLCRHSFSIIWLIDYILRYNYGAYMCRQCQPGQTIRLFQTQSELKEVEMTTITQAESNEQRRIRRKKIYIVISEKHIWSNTYPQFGWTDYHQGSGLFDRMMKMNGKQYNRKLYYELVSCIVFYIRYTNTVGILVCTVHMENVRFPWALKIEKRICTK